jgi:hypothetical protein
LDACVEAWAYRRLAIAQPELTLNAGEHASNLGCLNITGVPSRNLEMDAWRGRAFSGFGIPAEYSIALQKTSFEVVSARKEV